MDYSTLAWLAVAASVLAIAGYELRMAAVGRRSPQSTARSSHALLRSEWVEALSHQAGSEILAVQTLRNSLMSATIAASTAALALMGGLSLLATMTVRTGALQAPQPLSVRLVLELLLLATLFASYVCSAMAMRYFNHAGFVMSLPVGSEQRKQREPMAADYVRRAGLLYSWGLRLFLFVAPVVAGLVSPYAMPFAAVGLVFVLAMFDRGPASMARDGEGRHVG